MDQDGRDEMAEDQAEIEFDVDVQVAPEFVDLVAVERLRAAARAVLRHESRTGELALVITDDEGIRSLNRDFLDVDAPTDVLAFPTQGGEGPFVAAPGTGSYLGDVIISYPRAEAQAREQGHATAQELDLLIVHGVLHLLDYDHASAEEEAAMWARQEAVLESLR
jgi:probable rRNA maturation factor